jgi:hypothetical protein
MQTMWSWVRRSIERRCCMWKYRVGDVVQHVEYREQLIGVVIQTRLSTEVDDDMDPGEPFCRVIWTTTPEGEVGQIGQEHESQLELVVRPPL